jgi:hypothetical protein
MNVEIGAEAAQFPEKEYINGIAVAVRPSIEFSPDGEIYDICSENILGKNREPLKQC